MFGATASSDWPILLIVGLVLVVALVGFFRMRRRMGRRTPSEPLRPVAVPPEEIELEEGPIWACLSCGSPQVRGANVREGGIPGGGEGLAWICARCGHRGPALEFADPTAWRAFVKGLHEERDRRDPPP